MLRIAMLSLLLYNSVQNVQDPIRKIRDGTDFFISNKYICN